MYAAEEKEESTCREKERREKSRERRRGLAKVR